jgi:hypothetical protein
MIQILRSRLEARGPCRGYILQIQFHTSLSDRRFEAFVERFHLELSELRLVNVAAGIASRSIDIDTIDVLGSDPGRFLEDVRTALRAAGCDADLTVHSTGRYHPPR